MNKLILLAILLHIGPHIVLSKQHIGARIAGMGGNTHAITDVWNIMGNPAATTGFKLPTLSLSYQIYLPHTELSNQSFALLIPLNRTVIGLGLNRYGIPEFNEISIGTCANKAFGDHLTLALRLNYHQLRITNYGSIAGVSVDIGLFYLISQQLRLGFYVNNPAQQHYASTVAEKIEIPTGIYMGVSYEFSDKILMGATISKTANSSADIGVGIEYQIVKFFCLRTGLNLKPLKHYAGVGMCYRKVCLDVATQSDANIGYKPQIGASYAF